ncbi:MAG: IS66 family insertion sequence element accessory protein TnpB [Betaproteobacteria bacterium]|nr:IS66 family insertion sequence element accessory protein TnpB [Betaproteobacteria bacterium]
MRSDKLSEERIGEILATLDELKAGGVNPEVFAQSHGVSYGQLRGEMSHAPCWRAQLAGQEVPARARGFVQAKLSAGSGAIEAHARITCVAGARQAQIDWPVAHAAECAQWLRAWLG